MSEMLVQVLIQAAITFETEMVQGFLHIFAVKGLHFAAVQTRGFS